MSTLLTQTHFEEDWISNNMFDISPVSTMTDDDSCVSNKSNKIEVKTTNNNDDDDFVYSFFADEDSVSEPSKKRRKIL